MFYGNALEETALAKWQTRCPNCHLDLDSRQAESFKSAVERFDSKACIGSCLGAFRSFSAQSRFCADITDECNHRNQQKQQ
jgi:hypothetical protein